MNSGICKFFLLITVSFHFTIFSFSQTLTIVDSSQNWVSFRGLSVAKDGTIWVSGSKGTMGRSTNDGKSWNWVYPGGFEKRDFRDIEAFDSQIALAMAVDSPGIILRTIDGGKNWKLVYENHQSGIFLDDMSFRNSREGICAGDPIKDGRLVVISTQDSGKLWTTLSTEQRPLVKTGEAMFAASGGNLIPHPKDKNAYLMVTGGTASNLWEIYPFKPKKSPISISIPIQQGASTTGANAIFSDRNYLMIAGGNFNDPAKSDSCYAVKFKKRPLKGTELAGGYRSSIADNGNGIRVSCGITGISVHRGPFASYPTQWVVSSKTPFHVVRVGQQGGIFWLAGPGGKIAMLSMD